LGVEFTHNSYEFAVNFWNFRVLKSWPILTWINGGLGKNLICVNVGRSKF